MRYNIDAIHTTNRFFGILLIVLLVCGCTHNPRVYSSSRLSSIDTANVALLPFDNLTEEKNASRQVYDIFLVELLKIEGFSVIDPGEVERVLADERIRYTAELSWEQISSISEKTGASALVQGVILEYGMRQVQGFRVGQVPYVSLMIKMVDTESGKIMWASTYSRNGDDTETVFGFGRITSLNRLTEVMADEIVKSLEKVFRKRMEK
jgi:TolB-like protein